jgi:hypothetical protein
MREVNIEGLINKTGAVVIGQTKTWLNGLPGGQ